LDESAVMVVQQQHQQKIGSSAQQGKSNNPFQRGKEILHRHSGVIRLASLPYGFEDDNPAARDIEGIYFPLIGIIIFC
jgi:hypothetical protein